MRITSTRQHAALALACALALAPVTRAEPAAAPLVVAAAAPLVVYEKVAFDANVLFEQLDQFVDKIHGLEAQDILAIGYADRMGSASQNQVLSEERVDAVKASPSARTPTTRRT